MTRSGNPVQAGSARSSPVQAQVQAPEGTARTKGDEHLATGNAEAQQITETPEEEERDPEVPLDNYPFYSTWGQLKNQAQLILKKKRELKAEEKLFLKLKARCCKDVEEVTADL